MEQDTMGKGIVIFFGPTQTLVSLIPNLLSSTSVRCRRPQIPRLYDQSVSDVCFLRNDRAKDEGKNQGVKKRIDKGKSTYFTLCVVFK